MKLNITTKKDWIKLTCDLIPDKLLNHIPNMSKEKLAHKLYNDNSVITPFTDEQMSPFEAVEDFLEDQFSLDLIPTQIIEEYEEKTMEKGTF
mgnify:CR=1 FL=1|tara:strand:+ start:37807 stop:38082 length:276 start_codon:yes stop_codon:yes gene_type:complete